MITFELETKIREIVAELAEPTINRVQECTEEVTRISGVLDDQRHKVMGYQQGLDEFEVQMKMRMQEISSFFQKVHKIDADYQSRDSNRSAQILVLRSEFETMEMHFQSRNSSLEWLIASNQRLTGEVEAQSVAMQKMRNEIFQQLTDIKRDQISQSIEGREAIQFVKEDIASIKTNLSRNLALFDSMTIELETFKTHKDQMRKQLDAIKHDLDNRILSQTVESWVDQLSNDRASSFEILRQKIQNLDQQFSQFVQQTKIHTESLKSEQQKMDTQIKQTQTAQENQRNHYVNLNNSQTLLLDKLNAQMMKYNADSVQGIKSLFDQLSQQSNQISDIKQGVRNNFIKQSQELDNFKSSIQLTVQAELHRRTQEIKKELTETLTNGVQKWMVQELNTRLEAFQQLLNQRDVRDVEVQANIRIDSPPTTNRSKKGRQSRNESNAEEQKYVPINYDLIQEMIERTSFELINEKLNSSKQLNEQIEKVIQKNLTHLLSQVTQQLEKISNIKEQVSDHGAQISSLQKMQHKLHQIYLNQPESPAAYNLPQIQQNQSRQETSQSALPLHIQGQLIKQIQVMEMELLGKMELIERKMLEMRADQDTLFDQREELINRVKDVQDSVLKQDQKTQKYYTQIVKIKSDYMTDQEYALNQINLVLREHQLHNQKLMNLREYVAQMKEKLLFVYQLLQTSDLNKTADQSQKLATVIESDYKYTIDTTMASQKASSQKKHEALTQVMSDILSETHQLDSGYMSDDKSRSKVSPIRIFNQTDGFKTPRVPLIKPDSSRYTPKSKLTVHRFIQRQRVASLK